MTGERRARRGSAHGSRRASAARIAVAAFALLAGACPALAAKASASAASPAPAPASAPTLVVVGDSLSAEFGLRPGEGWVHRLELRLAERRPAWKVVNASISGDTTAGGRSRLPALLATHHPRVVIIELGGNDALRGTPLTATRQNLDAMIATAQAAGAKVVVAGIQVPPNYGRAYTQAFAQVFVDAAKAGHAALVPFILKGIADRPDADDWFQADRIHPQAKAHPLIVDNVWPVLQPLLGGTGR